MCSILAFSFVPETKTTLSSPLQLLKSPLSLLDLMLEITLMVGGWRVLRPDSSFIVFILSWTCFSYLSLFLRSALLPVLSWVPWEQTLRRDLCVVNLLRMCSQEKPVESGSREVKEANKRKPQPLGKGDLLNTSHWPKAPLGSMAFQICGAN